MNGWLEDGSLNDNIFAKLNLKYADLSHAQIRNSQAYSADFSNARFMFAKLIELDFTLSNFNNAYLGFADLSGSVFNLSIFDKADLTDANLEDANFGYAKLKGANLEGANLSNANLRGTDLTGAYLINAKLPDTSVANPNLDILNLMSEFNSNSPIQIYFTGGMDADTILPDGSRWTPETDMTRFTDPNHPNFWRSDNPNSPIYREATLTP